MESQRNILLIGLLMVSSLIWLQWTQKDHQHAIESTSVQSQIPSDKLSDVPLSDTTAQIIPDDSKTTHLIKVSTDNFDIKIDPNGGDIVFAALKNHQRSIDDSRAFTMLQKTPESVYIAQSGLIGKDGFDTQNGRAQYTSAATSYEMSSDNESLQVVLTTKNKQNIQLQKIYTFYKNSYHIDVGFAVNNTSDKALEVQSYGQIKHSILDQGGSMMMPTYQGGAYSTSDIRYQKYSFGDMEDHNLSEQTKGGWIAMLQHYFVSAWVPPAQESNKFYTSVRSGNLANMGYRGDVTTIPAHSQKILTSALYIGPKDQQALSELSENLNLVVDYGFLWWLASPIYSLLMFFQSFAVNWGLAIILVTLTVRMVLYPLTKAQYVSMAKMRNLQPKLQSLKDRYGEDRQKMGQAMMELYRKEKVNPMGGCLPMLLQMPIFIALYWVLMESVELRHAPFILWIKDLSIQDPYYVLPLLMGASMWFMQKLQPPAATLDPMQQKMMQYMPVMFTVFFLWFPSGLVLYWLVGNIVAIGQQLIIYKSLEKQGLK